MEKIKTYSFQIDSDIVRNHYDSHSNYLIEYSKNVSKEYCIVYFSSNDIYYPNNEISFNENIVQKNRYEWYKTRINIGYKHIFIRDIHKQWLLSGINSTINTPQKLLNFLIEETKDYKLITLGSSAGGFAAVIFGQLLNAEKILTFNGNFEIRSKLKTSSESICPLLFRLKDNEELNDWYDSRKFITKAESIYYFQSTRSKQDILQYRHVEDLRIKRIKFNNSHHGIPFFKTNLPFVLNLTSQELDNLTFKNIHPLMFSIKISGFSQTMIDLLNIATKKVYKILEIAIRKRIRK